MKNIFMHPLSIIPTLAICTLVLSLCLIATNANAQDHKKQIVDILPAISAIEDDTAILPQDTTHPIIRITPDRSELIYLKDEAGSIIIGNPLHINVIADTSKTLVIVPRSPGATHFTVLNKRGQIIMQRHVIVASPKEGYIRIKKTCREDSEGCQKTNVFYCPDMCHEIGLVQEEGSETSATEAAQDVAGSNNNANGGDVPPEADSE